MKCAFFHLVSRHAVDNTQKTIHENEQENRLQHRVRCLVLELLKKHPK